MLALAVADTAAFGRIDKLAKLQETVKKQGEKIASLSKDVKQRMRPPGILLPDQVLANGVGAIGLKSTRKTLGVYMGWKSDASDTSTSNTGWVSLQSLLLKSKSSERSAEYCFSLLHNLANPIVASITLLGTMTQEDAWLYLHHDCRVPAAFDEKLRILSVENDRMLTIAKSLQVASDRAREEGHGRLQVVAHADIVLGSSWGVSSPCLQFWQQNRTFIALSRHEPPDLQNVFGGKSRPRSGSFCFPGLDGQPRVQTRFRDRSNASYISMCDAGSGVKSQDAFAFVGPLDPGMLSRLNFSPNTMGAEQTMHCALELAGYHLRNPCDDLVIYHNHCSDYRTHNNRYDVFMNQGYRWCPPLPRGRAWKGVAVERLASMCPAPDP